MAFFKLLYKIISRFFDARIEQAIQSLEDRDFLNVALNIAIIIISGATGIIIPIWLVYRFRHLIITITAPIIFLALIVASFYENYKKPKPPAPPPGPALTKPGIMQSGHTVPWPNVRSCC